MENSIGMKLRVIPPGEFLMGSSEEEIAKLLKESKLPVSADKRILNERPQHRVTLTKPFGLAIHEVTRGQFWKFVDATGCKTDAEKDGKGGIGDDHPAVNVSWNDAVAFCEWLTEKIRTFEKFEPEKLNESSKLERPKSRIKSRKR